MHKNHHTYSVRNISPFFIELAKLKIAEITLKKVTRGSIFGLDCTFTTSILILGDVYRRSLYFSKCLVLISGFFFLQIEHLITLIVIFCPFYLIASINSVDRDFTYKLIMSVLQSHIRFLTLVKCTFLFPNQIRHIDKKMSIYV